MLAMPLRLPNRIRAVAIVGCVALASGLVTLGRDEPVRRDAGVIVGAEKPGNQPRNYFVEANFCRSCHSHPEDYKRIADRLLCRMSEYPIWDEQDKHKIANKVLLGARARQMGERLNLRVSES